jgi:hypothetical protein
MGDLAQYYYYRRLLFYYMATKEKRIAEMVKSDKAEVERIYSKDIVACKDKVRMRLFMLSPMLYRYIDGFYDKVVIPLRQKLRR